MTTSEEPTSRVLYARIPAVMHARLVELATETGLTLAGVTAEILARGLGPNTGALNMGVRRLHDLLDGAE